MPSAPPPSSSGNAGSSPDNPAGGTEFLPFTGFAEFWKLFGLGLFLMGLGLCLVYLRRNRTKTFDGVGGV